MLAIVQARLSSARLPGKVLRELAGQPMLGRVYSRLSRARHLSQIIVATSDEPSDDAICDFCRKQAIAYHRGSLNNVAQRFLDCAHRAQADAFLRICADSPLIDPDIVDQAIALHATSDADLTTNTQHRSFPKGQSVEIVRTSALADALARMRNPADQEHVTHYLYQHPNQYRIQNFASDESFGEVQLSVDTQADFDAIAAILQQAGDQITWRQAAERRLNGNETPPDSR
ncbi:MAG: glycosyltransferase family protein [Chromatiaceae bacterium]|nr:glycosyltransferase family protein [Chromatiaceae bacterium]MCF7993675.1 glycosyltransferase family protein [Chromatiaceae bacterium]